MHPHRPDELDPAQTGLRELRIVARDIRPGDHLPPQRALHGTRYQQDGFTVGPDDRDVTDLAVLPGRMLLFGPTGTLASVALDAEVWIQRLATRGG